MELLVILGLCAVITGVHSTCEQVYPDIDSTKVATMCQSSTVTGSEVYVDTDLAAATSLVSGAACRCQLRSQGGKVVGIHSYFNGNQDRDHSLCGTQTDFTHGNSAGTQGNPCYSWTYTYIMNQFNNISMAIRRNQEPYTSTYCIRAYFKLCTADQFQCDTGECISKDAYCDEFPDCPDSSDEKSCDNTKTCQEGTVACDNGQCINPILRCDGKADCSDNSDERCDGSNWVSSGGGSPTASTVTPSITVTCEKSPYFTTTTTSTSTTTTTTTPTTATPTTTTTTPTTTTTTPTTTTTTPTTTTTTPTTTTTTPTTTTPTTTSATTTTPTTTTAAPATTTTISQTTTTKIKPEQTTETTSGAMTTTTKSIPETTSAEQATTIKSKITTSSSQATTITPTTTPTISKPQTTSAAETGSTHAQETTVHETSTTQKTTTTILEETTTAIPPISTQSSTTVRTTTTASATSSLTSTSSQTSGQDITVITTGHTTVSEKKKDPSDESDDTTLIALIVVAVVVVVLFTVCIVYWVRTSDRDRSRTSSTKSGPSRNSTELSRTPHVYMTAPGSQIAYPTDSTHVWYPAPDNPNTPLPDLYIADNGTLQFENERDYIVHQ